MFITFEGGDGAGKTTQVRMLVEWLSAGGKQVVQTLEPGGTPLGQALRELVLFGEDMNPRAEALLYAADRSHHVDTVIRPALDAGKVVVCDRYIDSSVAYQGMGRGLGERWVEELNLWAVEGLRPDVTFLLDLDPLVTHQRISRQMDRLERAGHDFHVRTREAFLARAQAEPDRFVVIDAQASPEQVHAVVRQDVAPRLGLNP
ncbi:MAG TPA: dTMP kinase [Beutenbergiaceae bacterium]|nr:dTMP kinase [Beutenbergiaceae bacterium]